MARCRFLVALLLLPLSAAAVAAPRYFADPYMVFRPPAEPVEGARPNMRYVKQLRLEDCPPGRGYVLGTSRATGYDVEALESAYGFPFYNLTVPTETWRGLAFRARYLMAQCDPALLWIALDPLTFRVRPYEADYLRLEPPVMTGRSELLFRLDYLRAPMGAALRPPPRAERIRYDPETGHWSIPRAERMRERGRALEERGRCGARRLIRHAGRYRGQVEVMTALRAGAEAAGTPVVWAVNPLSATFLNRIEEAFYRDWTRTMLETTGELLMLGGYNAFTTDGLNYWEHSHFRIGPGGRVAVNALAHRNDRLLGVWTVDAAGALDERLAASFRAHRSVCGEATPS